MLLFNLIYRWARSSILGGGGVSFENTVFV